MDFIRALEKKIIEAERRVERKIDGEIGRLLRRIKQLEGGDDDGNSSVGGAAQDYQTTPHGFD